MASGDTSRVDTERRVVGWRVRYEHGFGDHPRVWEDRVWPMFLTGLDNARKGARELRGQPQYRNVRVFRVSRKAKS